PRAVRGHHRREPQALLGGGRLGGADTHAAAVAVLGPHQQVGPHRAPLHAAAGHRTVLLDLEQVGEVAVDHQPHLDAGGLGAVVVQRDVLAHAGADVAVALDDDRRLHLPGTHRRTADELRLEGLDARRGQRLDLLAVDLQHPRRQDPGVLHEETLPAPAVQVPRDVAHAERGALDERDLGTGDVDRVARRSLHAHLHNWCYIETNTAVVGIYHSRCRFLLV